MLDHGQRSEIAQPHVRPRSTRTEPGTYMVPELNTGERFEPVPLDLVYRASKG